MRGEKRSDGELCARMQGREYEKRGAGEIVVAASLGRDPARFQAQYGGVCVVYVRGDVLLETGEVCMIHRWMRVACPGDALDLLGLGASEEDEEEKLTWVNPTTSATLLLSTFEVLV